MEGISRYDDLLLPGLAIRRKVPRLCACGISFFFPNSFPWPWSRVFGWFGDQGRDVGTRRLALSLNRFAGFCVVFLTIFLQMADLSWQDGFAFLYSCGTASVSVRPARKFIWSRSRLIRPMRLRMNGR